MTITLPPPVITASITEHPWLTVVLLFLFGVVMPAVWSTHPPRRRAAMAVILAILDVIALISITLHRDPRL